MRAAVAVLDECFVGSQVQSRDQRAGILQCGQRKRFPAARAQPQRCVLELGLGFGVLPREIADPLIHENKLAALNQGRSYKIRYALAWYPRREMPDYFREIIRMILINWVPVTGGYAGNNWRA